MELILLKLVGRGYMVDQVCAICGKNAPFKILYPANFKVDRLNEDHFSARRVPDHLHYRLVRCKKCCLIFSNPILKEKEINKLYRKSKVTYELEIESLKKSYGYYLKKVIDYVPSKESLLEIGCGNGFFLEEALEQGFGKAWGVEPSVSAVKNASDKVKRFIKNDTFKKGLFENNFFDVVCFFQTLDHIIDPNKFLRTCYEVLKEKGVIFCIVHDTDSLSARLMGEKSPIFDIEHTYLFNKQTLRRLFEKNNFKVLYQMKIVNEYSFKYWNSLLPFGKSLKKFIEKVLVFSGLDGRTLRVKAGNIGIISRKKLLNAPF